MDEQILMDDTLRGNEIIEEAIHAFRQEQTDWHFMGICMAIRSRIGEEGHLIFPADIFEDETGNTNFSFKMLDLEDGTSALVAFTSMEERKKAPPSGAVSQFIDCMLEPMLQMEQVSGLWLNPWGEGVFIGKEDIAMILTPGSERFV